MERKQSAGSNSLLEMTTDDASALRVIAKRSSLLNPSSSIKVHTLLASRHNYTLLYLQGVIYSQVLADCETALHKHPFLQPQNTACVQ